MQRHKWGNKRRVVGVAKTSNNASFLCRERHTCSYGGRIGSA